MNIEDIARVTHEANRALCASQGDLSQPPWGEAPEWQRGSAVNGIMAVAGGAASPEDSHKGWLAEKEACGWVYGPAKDQEAKTHPCMVPYDQLPPEQQAKDHLFIAVANALLPLVPAESPA